jgi:glycosyl transferase family 87
LLRYSSQLGLALALLAAVSMWCYADFILIPHQQRQSAALQIPRGNLSDLYPRWLGARELLLHRRDPYSFEVTREIQHGYYGRELNQARANDPKDQQGFAYPVYVVFLLAPTVTMPFEFVQIAFRWFLILLTAGAIPLWVRAIRSRTPFLTMLMWMIFALGSFAALQGIKLQQLTLLVCSLIAGAMAALSAGYLVPAGILLALSTIKPQLVGILAGWLLLWTLADWRSRKKFAISFFATLVALMVGGEWLLPGWISKFRAAAKAYIQYTGGGKSVLDVALGPTLGTFVAVLILVMVAIFCWRQRAAPQPDPAFAWSLALVLAATLAVIPTYAPYNQLLLVPALMLIARDAAAFWKGRRIERWLLFITAFSLLWPWLTAATLCALLPLLSRERLEKLWVLPLASSLWIPVTVLGFTGLCAWKKTQGRNLHMM